MATVNRTIENEYDRKMTAKLIDARTIPFVVTITDGKHRTTKQNKLNRKWMLEIAEQKGDMTAEEVRAYVKLTIGVPILREENEAFRLKYDEIVRPLPYEQKLAIMAEPLDMPITRLMTTKQQAKYMDRIIQHFGSQGIILTMPEDLKYAETDDAIPQAAGADEITSPETEDAAVPPKATASASSNLFKWHYADGELVHLRDFARKALDDAASDNDDAAKDAAIDRLRLNYLEVIESEDGRKAIGGMLKAVAAVLNRKKSKEEAAIYIATEFFNNDNLGGRP